MSFLSPVVIAWLSVAVLFAWLLPRNLQPVGIALGTAAFLAYASPLSLVILTVSSLAVFFLVGRGRARGAIVVCLVGAISAIFIWFKLKVGAAEGMSGMQRLLPLGLSFYSFRQIHYIFESYQRRLEEHSLAEFLCYLFFLPTIPVGPIHRFPEFLRDLRRRRWEATDLSDGLERILYGYAKIVILGNYLVGKKFELLIRQYAASNSTLDAYLGSVSYWANLYFQFSGYSDIAIGFSLTMGFRVMENFNYPFLAANIAEFWQRWHISLTSWCRDYVYAPLASLTRRAGVSVLAAMLILGLWHEFSGRYVIWGCYQALGVVIWHRFQAIKQKLPPARGKGMQLLARTASVLLTVHFVMGSTVVTNIIYHKLQALF